MPTPRPATKPNADDWAEFVREIAIDLSKGRVVFPTSFDTTIRLREDTFDNRADLPAAWAGLTDQALEQASGVKGAKFCHNGRFIAVADSREAILALATLAVTEVEAERTA